MADASLLSWCCGLQRSGLQGTFPAAETPPAAHRCALLAPEPWSPAGPARGGSAARCFGGTRAGARSALQEYMNAVARSPAKVLTLPAPPPVPQAASHPGGGGRNWHAWWAGIAAAA